MKKSELQIPIERYPKYKDSGVDWIGDIPVGWDVLPGLRFLKENKDKNTGFKRNTVLSLSYGNIRIKQEEELTGLVPESFETYQLVNKGDIIFRPTDLQNDKVSLRSSISEYAGIITSAYLNLRIKRNAHCKFIHYFFRAIDNNKVIYGLGSGLRQNIDFRDFRRFQFSIPPLPEQTAIAEFLDEKCGKIDRAVAKKEKLIELLKERKQIVIQNAVTRGLDHDAEMKNSGVDWIGEIPAHWEVSKLKFITSFILDGTHGSFSRVDKGYRLLSVRNIINGKFVFRNDDSKVSRKHFKEISSKFLIKENDIQLAIVGATLGKTAITPSLPEEIVTQRSICTIRTTTTYCLNTYVCNYMQSQKFQSYLWNNAGFSAQPGVYLGTIQNSHIPLPPLPEQTAIVAHIEAEFARLDKAVAVQERLIHKLKEYKSTLINSAVTGKIKVC